MVRLSFDIDSAQKGNDKMENMADTKLLNFSLERSCVVVLGNKINVRQAQDKLTDNSLQLCDRDMV